MSEQPTEEQAADIPVTTVTITLEVRGVGQWLTADEERQGAELTARRIMRNAGIEDRFAWDQRYVRYVSIVAGEVRGSVRMAHEATAPTDGEGVSP